MFFALMQTLENQVWLRFLSNRNLLYACVYMYVYISIQCPACLHSSYEWTPPACPRDPDLKLYVEMGAWTRHTHRGLLLCQRNNRQVGFIDVCVYTYIVRILAVSWGIFIRRISQLQPFWCRHVCFGLQQAKDYSQSLHKDKLTGKVVSHRKVY